MIREEIEQKGRRGFTLGPTNQSERIEIIITNSAIAKATPIISQKGIHGHNWNSNADAADLSDPSFITSIRSYRMRDFFAYCLLRSRVALTECDLTTLISSTIKQLSKTMLT